MWFIAIFDDLKTEVKHEYSFLQLGSNLDDRALLLADVIGIHESYFICIICFFYLVFFAEKTKRIFSKV